MMKPDNLDYRAGFEDGANAYRNSLLEWVDMWEDHDSADLEQFYKFLVARLETK